MSPQDPFLGVREELAGAMRRRSFAELTAVQRAVLEHDAKSTNLRIASKTGSGKTVALGIALADELIDAAAVPGRRKSPAALLVAPTRELALQLGRELGWLFEDTAITLTAVIGGADMRREKRSLSDGPVVVVGTPGRLLDHLRQGTLRTDAVQHVVLDEADQMLDMGFRDELEALVEALPPERRSHLVSATFPSEVRRFADAFQGNDVQLLATETGAPHEDIDHCAYVIPPLERYDALINELLMRRGQRCLVFVRRRIDTAEIAERLNEDGMSAQALSGELAQAQRVRCLEAFRRGQVRVLVATDVAARGIDVADIQLVVHLDLPSDPANYTHRSGRTGRAGNKGTSLVLVTPSAERRVRRMLQDAGVRARFLPPPTPELVIEAITAESHRRLTARLADAAPDEATLARADELLAEAEPRELVARLLTASARQPPTSPRRVRNALRPDQNKRSDKRPRPQNESFARFFLSWGKNHGAIPKRVLALVCRRGGIEGRDVGRIAVGPHSTVVEVAESVAASFATKAAVIDPREPRMRIEPFRDRPDDAHLRRTKGRPAPERRSQRGRRPR
jgi:ATP-dependent RNA helicase DeaD